MVLMVMFSFLGGTTVYRRPAHRRAGAGRRGEAGTAPLYCAGGVVCMTATALFMLMHGTRLCLATRLQSIAEFPSLPVAVVYLPIPLAGLLTLLFLVERAWLGKPPESSVMYSDRTTDVSDTIDTLVLLGSFTLLLHDGHARGLCAGPGPRSPARCTPTSRSRR